MPTVELHKFIQELHPDLCDDSVDRVFDGENFGHINLIRRPIPQLANQRRVIQRL
jgi:hypothetical protein